MAEGRVCGRKEGRQGGEGEGILGKGEMGRERVREGEGGVKQYLHYCIIPHLQTMFLSVTVVRWPCYSLSGERTATTKVNKCTHNTYSTEQSSVLHCSITQLAYSYITLRAFLLCLSLLSRK